ncbi:hypothetical protein BDR05DRAFT_1002386 [Suillus weaverae]|nr:hypothetical protein BDR05DRAFT_1002386 [Suillus weaverae]
MVEHVLDQHEEYSVPGHREAGAPLPAEIAAQIPKECWQIGQEADKENVASGFRTRKRPALKLATSLPTKRPCTTIQPLQISHTSIA